MKKTLVFVLFICINIGFAQKPQQSIVKLHATECDFIQAKTNRLAINEYVETPMVVLENGEVKQSNTFDFTENFSYVSNFPYQTGIAQSGDLGYTLSDWKNKTTTGTTVKIWRKTNEKWKVILQTNVSHPLQNNHCYDHYLPVKAFSDLDLAKNKAQGAEQLIFMRDYYYTKNAKTSPNPFEPSLSSDILLIQTNLKSINGISNSNKWLKDNFSKTEIQTAFKATASSTGDLVIVYGITQSKNKQGNFLRIWREEAKDTWKIVLEAKQ